MQALTNKQILLGITGGIAAYKSADLVRRLQDLGATVKVVMTPAATQFITPLTLQALSGNPVHLELLDTDAEAAMGHIELARWADVILIAPASADFISQLAVGSGSDLLSTLCLASKARIVLAPAMNQGMWSNPSTQDNITTLKARNIVLFGPADGSQACGDIGPGRMLEPHEIAQLTTGLFESTLLTGRQVVITAGPTREALDPVRYISNYSSGKMGFALARAAAEAGAKTTLVAGPVNLPTPAHVKRIDVISAQDMLTATMQAVAGCDIFIASAAVADYRPAQQSSEKIKKGPDDSLQIKLIKNADIVANVASLADKPFTVGFAAETQNIIPYAREKLTRKNIDLIIANDVSDASIGFDSDDNAVTVVDRSGDITLDKRSKNQLADHLIELIANRFHQLLGD